MGLHRHPGTMPGGVTPICNACGVSLCWDISEEEAEEARDFWEGWKCEDCNGGVRMRKPRQDHSWPRLLSGATPTDW